MPTTLTTTTNLLSYHHQQTNNPQQNNPSTRYYDSNSATATSKHTKNNNHHFSTNNNNKTLFISIIIMENSHNSLTFHTLVISLIIMTPKLSHRHKRSCIIMIVCSPLLRNRPKGIVRAKGILKSPWGLGSWTVTTTTQPMLWDSNSKKGKRWCSHHLPKAVHHLSQTTSLSSQPITSTTINTSNNNKATTQQWCYRHSTHNNNNLFI